MGTQWFVRRACYGTRGASLVEYLIVVGLVALIAVGGFQALGGSVHDKITCMAATLMGGAPCEDGASDTRTARGPLVTTAPGTTNPEFGDIGGTDDAAYGTLEGTPYQTGEGDGTAVHPNDLSQGGIADCYFISSMGAVAARDPAELQNLIHANEDGTYTVTFHEPNPHSWWQFWESDFKEVKITVTPDFPTKDGRPIFAQPGDAMNGQEELWPMILEKAYAQYSGGYNAIEYDFPDVPLQLLTGEGSERMPADVSFDQFHDHWDDGDAITGWTAAGDDAAKNPLFQEDGPLDAPLVANHVYYVIGVDEDAQTVTLKNPWGWDSGGEITLTWEQYRSGFVGTTTNPID